MKRVYLDAAASHPIRARALWAFAHAALQFGNPSAPHVEGQKAFRVLERARTEIARLTGAKPDAVIFTSGATESNALAILGHVRARLAGGIDPKDIQVLFSETQHASVIGAVEEVRKLGVEAITIPLHEGAVDLEALKKLITPRTTLITLDVVCGETGTRFDTRAVRKIIDECKAEERPVFHVDATQAPLVENMERTRLGADLISFDAQKIGGIRGIGALIAPRTIPLAPLYEGGGQERGLRSGTPSPALAAAFTEAFALSYSEREAFVLRAKEYKKEMSDTVLKKIPGAVINGGKESAPHILNFSFIGRDTDYLVALLDEAGFAVSTRSSCETDAEGSRVVFAYTRDTERATSTLRISFHTNTKKGDIEAFVRALSSAISFIDSSKGARS